MNREEIEELPDVQTLTEEEVLDFYALDSLTSCQWPAHLDQDDIESDIEITKPKSITTANVESATTDEETIIDLLDPTGRRIHRRRPNSGNDTSHLGTASASSENFDPLVFLKEIHSDTSFDNLLRGYTALREATKKRTATLKHLVKNNFDRFISCKDTIDHVYGDLIAKGLLKDSLGAANCDAALKDSYTKAREIFQPILERKCQIDKLHSAIGSYEQLKLIFVLPANLDSAIRKRDYDQAVREYRRARSLIGKNNDDVVNDVWQRIQMTVASFKQKLFKELDDSTLSWDTHEKIIGHLADLEAEVNPYEYYLLKRHKRNLDLFNSALDQYSDNYQQILKVVARRSRNDSSTSCDEESMTFMIECLEMAKKDQWEDLSRHITSQSSSKDWSYIIATKIKFAEQLSALVLFALPEFWKIARTIMDGRSPKVTEYTKRRQEDLKQYQSQAVAMLTEQIDFFANTTRLHLLRDSEYVQQCVSYDGVNSVFAASSTIQQASLSHSLLHYIGRCQHEIDCLKLPSEMKDFTEIYSEAQLYFLSSLPMYYIHESKYFFKYELWSVEDAQKGTSHLPLYFRQFSEIILKTIFQLSNDMSVDVEKSYILLKEALLKALTGYLSGSRNLTSSKHVSKTTRDGDDTKISMRMLNEGQGVPYDKEADRQPMEGMSLFSEESRQDNDDDDDNDDTENGSIPDKRSRCLHGMCNLTSISLSLPSYLKAKLGDQTVKKIIDQETWDDIIDQEFLVLYKQYIANYISKIDRSIASAMSPEEMERCRLVTHHDARSYIHQILMEMVFIYADLRSFSSVILEDVMRYAWADICTRLYENLEICQPFRKQFSQQMLMEVHLMKETLKIYATKESDHLLDSILNLLGGVSDDIDIDRYVRETRERRYRMYVCFQSHDGDI